MKIAVVTVYDGLNYGSFLQAYAMQAWLWARGHQVVFVRRFTEKEDLALFTTRRPEAACGPLRSAWRKFRKVVFLRRKLARENAYYREQFPYYQEAWKQLTLTDPGELSGVECLLCGSDEIWNPENLNIDVPFYACVGYGAGIPRVGAAVSAGGACPEDLRRLPEVVEALRGFEGILARDHRTRELLEPLLGRQIPVICDPTLMVDRAVFRKHERGLAISGEYLLVYTYGLSEEESRILKDFAGREGCRIVSACMEIPIADQVVKASPLEFAGLVANARYCVTTTFHGTAFSLLFARSFCAVARYPKIAELAGMAGEEGRLWDGSSSEELARILRKELDRGALDARLAAQRERSSALLEQELERIRRREEKE